MTILYFITTRTPHAAHAHDVARTRHACACVHVHVHVHAHAHAHAHVQCVYVHVYVNTDSRTLLNRTLWLRSVRISLGRLTVVAHLTPGAIGSRVMVSMAIVTMTIVGMAVVSRATVSIGRAWP